MRRLSSGNIAHGCEMCDGEDECTCRPAAASAGYRVSEDLLPCPECSANPVNSCTISVTHGREPHDKHSATARCHECGYAVCVVTSGHPGLVRRLWNVRTR